MIGEKTRILSIRKKSDFVKIYKSKFVFEKSHLKMLIDRHESNDMKLAIVIAKAKLKRAVDRNKLRRIITNCIRTSYKKSLAGYSVLIFLKTKIKKLDKSVKKKLQFETHQLFDALLKC